MYSTSDMGSHSEDAGTMQSHKIEKLQNEDNARHAKACTFRPRLNGNTERIVGAHAAFRQQGFLERQMLFQQRSKGQLQSAAQRVAEQESPTFEPELTRTSQLLAHAKRETESSAEKMNRLAVRDKERTGELRRSIEEQYYAQFTFQPKLNKISRALAETKEGADVTTSKTGRVSEDLLQELEENFKKSCTFKPVIHSSGPRDRESLNVSHASAVQDYVSEKERWLAEARREQQYDELKECTFQPKVKRKRPDFKGEPVEVPGMAKFLDRKLKARQMEDDKKAREQQAFEVKGGAKNGQRYTVPKPFNLHTAYHSMSKKEKLEASLRAKAEEDCTFTPCTNAKVAYDILRRYILQDDADSDEDAGHPGPGAWGQHVGDMAVGQAPGAGLALVDLEGMDAEAVHGTHAA
jgi:hypothetical protein